MTVILAVLIVMALWLNRLRVINNRKWAKLYRIIELMNELDEQVMTFYNDLAEIVEVVNEPHD